MNPGNQTVVELALERPDIGGEFAAYLRGLPLLHGEAGASTKPRVHGPPAGRP